MNRGVGGKQQAGKPRRRVREGDQDRGARRKEGAPAARIALNQEDALVEGQPEHQDQRGSAGGRQRRAKERHRPQGAGDRGDGWRGRRSDLRRVAEAEGQEQAHQQQRAAGAGEQLDANPVGARFGEAGWVHKAYVRARELHLVPRVVQRLGRDGP